MSTENVNTPCSNSVQFFLFKFTKTLHHQTHRITAAPYKKNRAFLFSTFPIFAAIAATSVPQLRRRYGLEALQWHKPLKVADLQRYFFPFPFFNKDLKYLHHKD